MPKQAEIIAALDEEIKKLNLEYLTAPAANKVLEEKGLLSDSLSRPGLPLRNLLREGFIPHAFQVAGKWRIPCSEKSWAPIPKYSNKNKTGNQKSVRERAQIPSRVGWWIAGILLAVYLFSKWGGDDTSQESIITNPDDLKVSAFIISQNYIEAGLKAPSTADFPITEYSCESLGNNRFKVSSYVDAQNGFGAQIRTYYVATLTYLGGERLDYSNWRLENLETNP